MLNKEKRLAIVRLSLKEKKIEKISDIFLIIPLEELAEEMGISPELFQAAIDNPLELEVEIIFRMKEVLKVDSEVIFSLLRSHPKIKRFENKSRIALQKGYMKQKRNAKYV